MLFIFQYSLIHHTNSICKLKKMLRSLMETDLNHKTQVFKEKQYILRFQCRCVFFQWHILSFLRANESITSLKKICCSQTYSRLLKMCLSLSQCFAFYIHFSWLSRCMKCCSNFFHFCHISIARLFYALRNCSAKQNIIPPPPLLYNLWQSHLNSYLSTPLLQRKKSTAK